MSLRELLRARPDSDDPLGRHGTDSHPGVKDKKKAAASVITDAEHLAGLQERLFAEDKRTLLLVLQGIDTSGKDGTIKHVIGEVNPLGCKITSFKKPTAEEAKHHFLWRIRRALPEPGQIGVFGRSHYEDVIVPRVHGGLGDRDIDRRYSDIAGFEAGLAAGTTTIVKCFLHISFEEQCERLLARLDDPTKRWKFNPADIDERQLWPKYQETFGEVLRRSSYDVAPWYVIPADRKWYRNWAVSRLLLETLTEMAPEYPQPDLDIPDLKARLTGRPHLRAVK
ncbi:MAG TPA: PPK2 family polyphosphate kinase [Acidimicrobiia bacterium]|nr:PPK2 family polyphosphate kinase [Acidimicrobiia bacterium]